uniref:Pyridoxamine 5'-phosphate oxidase N-terminal domain-containing protein n=1 Tax=Pseudo-nitzschia australis TaxID=44445 RepID=A0A7S4ANC2_9STRA|mmetsp:Transcript_8089/g.17427  ORF Transcript_8089/g.17427 Transcript_8089/m.17427 type:complete len:266 (+) Transcript_8089:44-841(+)
MPIHANIFNKNSSANNSANASVLSIVLGTTVVVGTLSSLGWYYYFTRAIRKDSHYRERRRSSVGEDRKSSSSLSSLIKPPFPQTLREMLSKCRLAYLSTADNAATSSHLSLMRFTYLHDPVDGEVVIMSTNRKTKKFEMLSQQNGVALLVHDFDDKAQQLANGKGNSNITEPTTPQIHRSITLNGNCCILEGDDETKYRQAHLRHNPDYPQFIVGEDIAVLCIHVTSARICDLNDRVVHWNVDDVVQEAATATPTHTPRAKVARI